MPCEVCGGEYYCSDGNHVACANHAMRCSCCFGSFPPSSINVINGAFVCNGCTVDCECGSKHAYTDTRLYNGKYWCKKYLWECQRCGGLIHQDEDHYSVFDHHVICVDCFNRYSRCRCCGVDMYHGSMIGFGDTQFCSRECLNKETLECQDCGRLHLKGGKCRCLSVAIHDHGFKPKPKFHGNEGPYFGIELEVECNKFKCNNGHCSACEIKKIATQMSRRFARNYIKRDGSVGNGECGFEFVTHPFNWEWLQDNKTHLASVLNELSLWGQSYNAKSSCGLHIHVSRKDVSQMHLYRMLKLVFDNPGLIFLLSRRKLSALQQYAQLYDIRDANIDTIANKFLKKKDFSRYYALNVEPDNTIEFRIFRGTLSYHGVMRALQVCKSIYDYTKTHTVDLIKAERYVMWVHENVETFPELSQFLTLHDGVWRRKMDTIARRAEDGQA